MSQDIHTIEKGSFSFRMNTSFADSRHEGNEVDANRDDDRGGRVLGQYPRNNSSKSDNQKNSINFSNFFKTIFDRRKEDDNGKYFRCRGRQSTYTSSLSNLSEKYNARDNRPDKPSVWVRFDSPCINVEDVRHVAHDSQEGSNYGNSFFHIYFIVTSHKDFLLGL